jgi:hypothetical protein
MKQRPNPPPGPDDPSLPWVLRQGSLRFVSLGVDDEGRTTILLRSTARSSNIITITLHMRSEAPVSWHYGYSMRGSDGRQRTYSGTFGDPRYDTEIIDE